ncbi:hypothetical protein ACO2Q3_04380 [Caulobacter sp. KR2-114]|uniref:hypothetical protein n=1 Tax=Caulobacter sp. KR2-114 TaxID=3400912 RepID=UPI003C07024C
MTRILAAAAIAAFAFASAANAEGVVVKTSGKTAEAIHHDIRLAARRVCDDEYTGVFDNYFMKNACVTATVARAESQLQAQSAVAQGHDAAATVASK